MTVNHYGVIRDRCMFLEFTLPSDHLTKQESCAIAKMTAQCAIYSIYGCPDNFRDSLTTPTATFLKILWEFVPIVPPERALVSFYRPSIVTFLYLYTFQRYSRFCSPAFHFFPYPTSTCSLPKISPCSPRSRWITFWLQRAKVLG